MDRDARSDSGMDSESEIISISPDSNRGGNLGMDYSPSTSPSDPPVSEQMVLPGTSFGDVKTGRPHTSMTCTSTTKGTDDPTERLENIFSSSHKFSECFTEGKSENDQFKAQGLRTPKINSHGKMKNFKCKQCGFLAHSKVDFWNHSREHIKPDKQRTCPKCPFVTEYKHHLEYHLRTHEGKKPHKCPVCPYTCVSKSMLTSHSKSHSNIEGECPNPRRRHKVKKQGTPSMSPFHKDQLMLNAPSQTQMPFPAVPFFEGFPLLPHILNMLMRRQQEAFSVTGVSSETSPEVYSVPGFLAEPSADISPVPSVSAESPPFEEKDIGVLDLSKPKPMNRRRGPAFTRAPSNENMSENEYGAETTVMYSTVEAIQSDLSDDEVTKTLICQFCDTTFGDSIIHTLHMGLHGYDNPFKCNMCGQEYKEKVSFYLHLVRVPHP